MGKFDLADFQKKITYLDAKKERINNEIDKEIDALKIAESIFRQGSDMPPESVTVAEGPLLAPLNYSEMTAQQAVLSILKEHNGITSKKIIKIAMDGGLTTKVGTIYATLTRLTDKGYVRAKGKPGKRKYYSVENETVAQNEQPSAGRRYPWTDNVVEVVKASSIPLTKKEITVELAKRGVDVNNKKAHNNITSAVNRQTEAGIFGKDTSGAVIKYFYKSN